MRRFALPQMPSGGVDLCLVDRRVVESLGNLQERNSSIFCLLMWAGYSQCVIPYRREARKAGRSKWTLSKKIKLFIDSFIGFSFLPMRLITGTGAVLSLLGVCSATLALVRALFLGVPVPAWFSVTIVVLLCSGAQLLALGILGEYLWRALDAARNRPAFLIREVSELESVEASVAPGTPVIRATATGGRS
jgi:dolichol-phosphate mannosyltransferase